MTSLFWHDYETWGEVPSLDRPSQFAGIRTDTQLNIIGEPVNLYCQPASDCLPKPEACLITGVTPQEALAKGLVEPEFFRQVHGHLALPDTCGVGYNSIRFDDEVTRFGLYRNFFDPYEREWKNGNTRWDIIDVVRLVYAFKPETLNWPRNDDNSPSFRLELLSAENGLAHEAAHDALSDVYATIALAKLIKDRQPKLYDYAFSLRNKRAVAELIDLKNYKPLLHTSSKFPAARACTALVMPLAWHPVNKNALIVVDLQQNPEALLNLTAEQLAERLYSAQADLPEGIERPALKLIHINKSPMLTTAALLNDALAEHCGIDTHACRQHWQKLKQAVSANQLQNKLCELYKISNFDARTDPDTMLYDGFIGPEDKRIASRVRQAQPQQLHHDHDFYFSDPRLQELLFRYRARFAPEGLSDAEQERWHTFVGNRLSQADAGGAITLSDFNQRLTQLQNQGFKGVALDQKGQDILNSLYHYGQSLQQRWNLSL